MSWNTRNKITRRNLMLSAAGAAVFLAKSGAQAGSLPQKAVSYQDKPSDGRMCE